MKIVLISSKHKNVLICKHLITCIFISQEEEFQDKRAELERKKLQIEKEFKNLDTQVQDKTNLHIKDILASIETWNRIFVIYYIFGINDIDWVQY